MSLKAWMDKHLLQESNLDFDAWIAEVTAIADREGLGPSEDDPPNKHPTWINHFKAGLTPQQAWDATPWRY